MPDKWDDAREKRLLLEVISICNPTVDRSAWEGVAAVMGDSFSAEACRQKFQSIKRNLKSGNGTTTTTTPKSATKATKPKTPTTSNGNATATKGRKRKATDANIDEELDADDDGTTLFAPKTPKMKKEKRGDNAEVFKAEENGDEGVDLERDDLYDDAA